MKKAVLRREFIKLRIAGKTNKECQKLLGINFYRRTLRRWWNRFNEQDNWDLKDTNKTPATVYFQFKRHKKHYEL